MRKLLSLCLAVALSACCLFAAGCGDEDPAGGNPSSGGDSSPAEEINFDGWAGEVTEDCHLGDTYTVNTEPVKASDEKFYNPSCNVADSEGTAAEVTDNRFLLRDVNGYKITYTIVVSEKTFVKIVNLHVINDAKPIICHGPADDGMVNRVYTLPDISVTDIFDNAIEDYTVKVSRKNGEETVDVPFETKTENEKTVRTFTPGIAGDYVIAIEAEFYGNRETEDVDFYVSEPINFDEWAGETATELSLGGIYTLETESVRASNNELFDPEYAVADSQGNAVEVTENQFLLRDLGGYKVTYTILAYEETFVKVVNINVLNDAKPIISHSYPCDGVINKVYTLPDITVSDVFGEPINERTIKLYRKNGEELEEINYEEKVEDDKTVRTFTPDTLSFYVIVIEAEFNGNKDSETLEFYVDNDNSEYEVRNFDNPYEAMNDIDFKFTPANGTVEVEWLPEYEGKRGVLKVSYSEGGYINFAIKPKHEKSVYEGSWQNFQVELFAPEGDNKLLDAGMEWADTLPTATWLDFGYGRWSKWVFGKDRFLPNFDAMVNLDTATGKMFFKTEKEGVPGEFYIDCFYQLPMA